MATKPHIIFFCTVWGEFHCSLFAQYGLPSLMTAGNIPYLCASSECTAEFVIYTRSEDMPLIEQSPALAPLRRLLAVSIRPLPQNQWVDWPMYINWAHRDLLSQATVAEPYLMPIWPDVVWCEQYCYAVLDRLLQGFDIVFSVGLRTNRSEVEPVLQQRQGTQPEQLRFSSGELVELGMKTLHRQYREYIYEAPRFTSWPAVVLFPIGDEGAIMRTFHVHVPVLKARRDILPEISPQETLDGGKMIGKLMELGHRCYYAQDSDECFHIELSREDYVPHISGPYAFDVVDTASWGVKELMPYHVTTGEQTFYLHAGPRDMRYRKRAQEAQQVMESVLSWYQFLKSKLQHAKDLEQHDQHRMSFVQHLETNALLAKGLNIEQLIWKMIQGDAAQIEHHASLLLARSLHINKQNPDPVEWAWYLIAYAVIGKGEEASKKQKLAPFIRHLEVERARWLLNTLKFKTLTPFESHLAPEEFDFSRYSSHIQDFRGWLYLIISLMTFNQRTAEAALLTQYMEQFSEA